MTKPVQCGRVQIGGGAPVSVQSMTNVDTRDDGALLAQIAALEAEGCDIVRVAVPDKAALRSLAKVRARTGMPIVADIHFQYRLALGAIDAGADKIRINPGNIGGDDKLAEIARAAEARGIPIRVGVNAGSLEDDILARYGAVTAEALAESALRTIDRMEALGFDNLVLSVKSSDVQMTYAVHQILRKQTEHPFHIGITESGTPEVGKLKSAIGIGSLLLAGIGDTLRVSLTADPLEEVRLGRRILETVGLRRRSIELVSCPTCGRTEVDLIALAQALEAQLQELEERRSARGLRPLKVAVMGCVVNGPGESKEADYGIAGGRGEGLVFAKGEVVARLPEDRLIPKLIELIEGDEE